MKWLIVIATLATLPIGLRADGPLVWPQFRGPGASGVAEGQKPPVEFGPNKNVKWKVPVPSGFSSPIIVGDKLVLTAFEGGKLYTIAYSRADGKELWRTEAPAKKIEPFHKTEGSPAASTPATNGEQIVSYFGSCGLFCYDPTGKQLWKLEMPTAATKNDFGTGVSPILVDGIVILQRDEMTEPKIVAVDAVSGKVLWEKKRESVCSYATPAILATPLGKQVVTAGYGQMIAYDLKTGAQRWSVPGMPSACCASPVVVDDTLFFSAWSPGDSEDKDFKMPSFDSFLKQAGEEKLGYLTKAGAAKTMLKDFFDNNDTNKDGKITRDEWDASLRFMASSKNSVFALKADGNSEASTPTILWKHKKGMPYVPSALVYGGQYIMVKDGGQVTAYDAKTGKAIYTLERTAAAGRYYASPVAANGHIYFTALNDGEVTVIKAGAETPTVVARNPELGERVAATPAIGDDTIYIRGEKHLYAFANKK